MSADRRSHFYEHAVRGRDWDDLANPFETRRRLRVVFDTLLAGVELDGATFLDAGSGGGHFSAEACRRGARVTSMDVGEGLLEQVAKRCDSDRVVGDLLAMPFADRSFAVVLSTEVIEHTADPMAALISLARVVEPGGYLAVTSPGRLWQPVVRLASRLRLRPYQGYENFLWPRRCRDHLQAAGLRVERSFGFNLLPLFSRRFEPLLRATDRLGGLLPSGFVNFGVLARRPG